MSAAYPPREDSRLLESCIACRETDEVLDMGTGSGILAIRASKTCKSVVAIDISRESLMMARKNAEEVGAENTSFVRSDLFACVKGKFDLMIFNPPYIPEDPKTEEERQWAGGKGREVIRRFLKDAKWRLRENGRILLLLSSLTGDIPEMGLYRKKRVKSQRLFFEELYVYELLPRL